MAKIALRILLIDFNICKYLIKSAALTLDWERGALDGLGKYNEALTALDKAIEWDSNYAPTWNTKEICGSLTLTWLLLQGLSWTLEPRERTWKDQLRLSSIVLHAPERSSCPLGDDSGSGKSIQGRRVQQFTHCNFPVHHIDASSNDCHYTQSIHFRQSGECKYFDTED